MLLLFDIAPVHTSNIAVAAVHDCGLQMLNYPPYSPDLASSDYYVFPKMKKEIREKKRDEEVKVAISDYFEDRENV